MSESKEKEGGGKEKVPPRNKSGEQNMIGPCTQLDYQPSMPLRNHRQLFFLPTCRVPHVLCRPEPL